MKIWYHNSFRGFSPVGTSAIVAAETPENAKTYLDSGLKELGLEPCDVNGFVEFIPNDGKYIILQDGDY